MYIGNAQSNNSLYAQVSASAGLGVPVKSIATNSRTEESVPQLQSDSTKPISYSPSIRDDRASRVQASDDPSDTSQSIVAQTSEERQSQQQEQAVEQVITQLKARDREVRAHEMAHLAAAGQYARGLSYTYQTGPDGKQYAVGGEVGIDTSPVPGDPQATIDKALVIQRAALAPAEPSAQDRRVAQEASQMMAQASIELREQRQEGADTQVEESNLSNRSTDLSQGGSAGSAATIEPNIDQSSFAGMLSERQAFALRLQISQN